VITCPIAHSTKYFPPLFRRIADGREWTIAAIRGPIADDFVEE
jgi:hypothetical protein